MMHGVFVFLFAMSFDLRILSLLSKRLQRLLSWMTVLVAMCVSGMQLECLRVAFHTPQSLYNK